MAAHGMSDLLSVSKCFLFCLTDTYKHYTSLPSNFIWRGEATRGQDMRQESFCSAAAFPQITPSVTLQYSSCPSYTVAFLNGNPHVQYSRLGRFYF